MSLSAWKQLEGFAFWHQKVLSIPFGKKLWGLTGPMEERLMNQAPLYIWDTESVDLYAEAVLDGIPQVDLSGQYRADAFLDGNPLAERATAKEGDFFHSYVKALALKNPKLPHISSVYLEADIREHMSPSLSSFVNLAGDRVWDLLPQLLGARGKTGISETVLSFLHHIEPWGGLWHLGFMDSRAEKPLRLVLLLHHGVSDIAEILHTGGREPLTKEAEKLLKEIEALGLFDYMLDLDIEADGHVGPVIGVELLPLGDVWPKVQQRWMQEEPYQIFQELLQKNGLADERIAAVKSSVLTEKLPDRVWLYARLSHFKLRCQEGKGMPAKVYMQIRSTQEAMEGECTFTDIKQGESL